jgi:hypothetical protein
MGNEFDSKPLVIEITWDGKWPTTKGGTPNLLVKEIPRSPQCTLIA